ncbi:uncharacterized protein LOC135266341 [Tribolium castaneum]|uniref:uncharacterized protein LOC135266341 n=1 Tax=Tribolium castaneum TaxID=7070 RepID=UPI0030FE325D
MLNSFENYKQIDDIIDARKKYAYSSAATTSDKFIRFEEPNMLISEGDYFSPSDIKPTDSEITIVRVRCDGLSFKRRPSKWDMHDIAIPGDGSHLGESPSMVNLATLVQQNDEYLVPLSSWDPYYNKQEEPHENTASIKTETLSENTLSLESKTSNSRRPSLAGRISKFLRRHCKKSKTLPETYSLDSDDKNSNN